MWKPVPFERSHSGEGVRVKLLDELLEYGRQDHESVDSGDGVDRMLVSVLSSSGTRLGLCDTLEEAGFRRETDLTGPADFLSNRINASKPTYCH